VQGQRGIELIENEVGRERVTLGVLDALQELVDRLQRNHRVHIGRERNQDGGVHARDAAHYPAGGRRQVEQHAVRSLAVAQKIGRELVLRAGVFGASILARLDLSSAIDVVADQMNGGVLAARRRREVADHAGDQFAGAEVKRQQAVRGGIGKQHLLAQRGQRAPEGRDQAGLAHSARQRKDGEDGRVNLILAVRMRVGGEVQAGLLEDTLQGIPARRNPLPRVLQRIPRRGRCSLRGSRETTAVRGPVEPRGRPLRSR
jgi:hypothetical protein